MFCQRRKLLTNRGPIFLSSCLCPYFPSRLPLVLFPCCLASVFLEFVLFFPGIFYFIYLKFLFFIFYLRWVTSWIRGYLRTLVWHLGITNGDNSTHVKAKGTEEKRGTNSIALPYTSSIVCFSLTRNFTKKKCASSSHVPSSSQGVCRFRYKLQTKKMHT